MVKEYGKAGLMPRAGRTLASRLASGANGVKLCRDQTARTHPVLARDRLGQRHLKPTRRVLKNFGNLINMITVLLVNMAAEVKILKYDTSSEKDACRFLIDDWIAKKIIWEHEDTNYAFDQEYLEKNGMDPMSDDYTPEYKNGVRIVEWYCGDGSRYGDDEIVWGYFIHSTQ